MIRLAVRVPRAAAELVLAELLELSPAGLEETDVSEGVVEYALYGAPGELPDLPALEAAAGDVLVEVSTTEVPDDWADRWKAWHRPVDVAWRFRRLRVRPPWEEALASEDGHRPRDRPGPGVRDGRASHDAAVPRAAARARPRRRAGRLGLGQRRAGDRGGAARYAPVLAVDVEPASLEASRENASRNGASCEVRRVNLRREPAPYAPTVLANLVRPLLLDVARLLERAPERLIASGLLREEADEVAEAFGPTAWPRTTGGSAANGPPCCSNADEVPRPAHLDRALAPGEATTFVRGRR